MPYVTQERRRELDAAIDKLSEKLLMHGYENMGDYNYAISKLIHEYIIAIGLRYKHLNDVVGMLECCKAEFIRTVVSPYEDKKIAENGFVSDLDQKQYIEG